MLFGGQDLGNVIGKSIEGCRWLGREVSSGYNANLRYCSLHGLNGQQGAAKGDLEEAFINEAL